MTHDTTQHTLRFSLALEPSHLLLARERVRVYLQSRCDDAELVEDLVLCLEEACSNVIRHSGAQDEMDIALWFEGDDLIAVVSDRGRGLDVGAFDPLSEPDALGYGGRGLYIIAQLMDELSLRVDGGLEVRMVKRAVAGGGSAGGGAGPSSSTGGAGPSSSTGGSSGLRR